MKILIAEDETVSRRLLQSLLTQWGHEVVQASDGDEAWRLFERDDFPIVISDWMMPKVDGLELIRRIRAQERTKFVYTILLTGRSDTRDIVVGMEAGADDFVSKPFDYDELRVRLREGERTIRLERSLAERNRVLLETQAALVQSEQLAGLGQLAAGMAHEINNPIAYVAGNIGVLRRDVVEALKLLDLFRSTRPQWASTVPRSAEETERMERDIDLDYLRDNVNRLFEQSLAGLRRVSEIVTSLRDFAKLDDAECEEFDVARAVGATVDVLRHDIAQKSLRIETSFADGPRVVCHGGKLNQVLLNLLRNAVQACGVCGRIEICSRYEGDSLVLEVRDDGEGIPAENLPRIFEPFFTTKAVGEGRGLGLAVSYGIVRDHGGSISAQSQVGEGSTFRVRLPLSPGSRKNT